ncbi:MAG TPA: hypothetical protein VFV34_16865, partial [Blastocatellia bacterium]|nr:hypothetical protein [Blastocatellia bacterium]
ATRIQLAINIALLRRATPTSGGPSSTTWLHAPVQLDIFVMPLFDVHSEIVTRTAIRGHVATTPE